MYHFWAVLGRAMADQFFWNELFSKTVPCNHLGKAEELWDFLTRDCQLPLTRYEVMEVNRIAQRDVEEHKHFMDQCRYAFPPESIRFPRDLTLCAVLGHCIVDESFAEGCHHTRTELQTFKTYIEENLNLPIDVADTDTIRRFFCTKPQHYENTSELLAAANQWLWVKPDNGGLSRILAVASGAAVDEKGKCGESTTYSRNYIHINRPVVEQSFLSLSPEDRNTILGIVGKLLRNE